MITFERVYNSLNYRYWLFIKNHFPYSWAKHLYKLELGKKINLKCPQDLNEKIQWLQFYTDTYLWSILADKYAVRDYVKSKVGEDILIPLLGMWHNDKDIDFNNLPNKFVIKPNNGSYDSIIVTDKNNIDIESVRKKMKNSLHSRFGLNNAEPHYLRIQPCIIAEQLLETDEEQGLIDYKIWCFNGTPHCIITCFNRDPVTHHANFMYYDLNWKRHSEYISNKFRTNNECEKPQNLDTMINIASKLSNGLPQCRVDLYNIKGKIYFGEITLTSNYGMMQYFTQEVLDEMGSKCILPSPTFKESLSCFWKRYKPIL